MASIKATFDLSSPPEYRTDRLPEIIEGLGIDSSELIGIEVEVENVANNDNPPIYWKVESDGSLRNNGAEYISRVPIPISHGASALKNLFDGCLSEERCFSPRTSVHVHMNMQNVSTEQAKDFVVLYALFERALYEFVGRGRSKNIYCVPITDTNLLMGFFGANLRHVVHDWSKYTGLNLHTLESYGTAEFRHMHGTADVGKLHAWLSIISALKTYVMTHPTRETRALLSGLTSTTDFGALATSIFGAHAEVLGPQAMAKMPMSYLNIKQAFLPVL